MALTAWLPERSIDRIDPLGTPVGGWIDAVTTPWLLWKLRHVALPQLSVQACVPTCHELLLRRVAVQRSA